MERNSQREPFPERRIYAKVESGLAVQDGGDGRLCVRLVGVSKESFDEGFFNSEDGCETYIVDIESSEFAYAFFWRPLIFINWYYGEYGWVIFENDLVFEALREPKDDAEWLEVNFETSSASESNSYAYTAFRPETPLQYLRVISIRSVQGNPVTPARPVPASFRFLEESPDVVPTLTAFHVGQGMCSLLAGKSVGYLLDAGAGTPLKRDAYRNGKCRNGAKLVNDLETRTASLTLAAIISHSDADHWRLLEWDSALVSRVDAIFVPENTSILAFSSPVTKSKVWGLGSRSIPFTNYSQLKVARSNRRSGQVTRNTDALVVQVHVEEKVALIPGDYVYEEMLDDICPDISSIPKASFDAVVVPHHGDDASAREIPGPNRAQAVAFFSAGDHPGYSHPRASSVQGHKTVGYQIVEDRYCENICGRNLLP